MKALLALIEKGGPVMIVIIVLSVVLYSRCFRLILTLRQSRRRLNRVSPLSPGELPSLRQRQKEIQDAFRQQRVALGAMIAAAPLLGLLGTVSGMTKTFDGLATRVGQQSMEKLASGISEVLVATESGLAVAIPALLIVYVAQREVHLQLQKLNQLEERVRGDVAP
ncbi:MAG TPA: MotA/TolQ/ExbB proton channel family protein [Opitutaceae bacterium]|nr:MotA/TolQ/ExbB proton channel family protein [Opitutaceae bacterium]